MAECKVRGGLRPWVKRRVRRIMCCEAIESSVCESIRREDGVPSPTYHTLRPDIKWMREIEQVEQKIWWQVEERITCVGYQALDKALFSLAERAD
jgi:hypothetical protein